MHQKHPSLENKTQDWMSDFMDSLRYNIMIVGFYEKNKNAEIHKKTEEAICNSQYQEIFLQNLRK